MNLVSRYRRSWSFLGRDLGYLLPALPIALVGFVVAVALFALGVSLAIVWIGIPILLSGLAFARGFATAELARLAAAGHPLPRPDWTAPDPTASLWRRSARMLGDGRYWLALLHAGVVNIALAVTSWSIAITWLATVLGGVTYGFWATFLPNDSEKFWLHTVVFGAIVPGYRPATTVDGLIAGESALNLGFALIALLTLAPLLRFLVGLHAFAARAMLGETRGAELAAAAVAAEASRSAAIVAEDAALRRLERDIHDGPQQALLRLQFDIASAERQLGPDDAHARSLLAGALQLSKDTLDELREISQGLAPPLLQDRGLASAVRALAGRSPVPVSTELDVARVPAVVERSAYFVVAELLANVAKHAAASAASVRLTDADGTLAITVSDDGIGGAHETPGHGLTGLHERVAGLRGTLEFGAGPGTTVIVRIPLS